MNVNIIHRTLLIKCWNSLGVNVCRKFSSVVALSPNKTFPRFKQVFGLQAQCTSSFIHSNSQISSNIMKNNVAKNQNGNSVMGATKKKATRKKRFIMENEELHSHIWSVKAMATAEEYNLEELLVGLTNEQLYIPHKIPTSASSLPDVIHARAKYEVETEPRELFFFREGTVVMWNISELECSNILLFLKRYQENSYPEKIVELESETMKYLYAEKGHSRLEHGNFVIAQCATSLDKYTFSNAMAQSVKLGIWEATLDQYIDSIEFVSEDLKVGNKLKLTQQQVLKKQGELFALRHSINLSSDLLDTPDFYWERDDLEFLYQQICSYFSITKRTKVINEKLNHCVELIGILSTHLSDQHHIRLEWMIIALIMIEVVFEVLHYIDRYFV